MGCKLEMHSMRETITSVIKFTFEIDGIDENHLSIFIHILLKKKIFNKSSSILTDIIIDLKWELWMRNFCSRSLVITFFTLLALSLAKSYSAIL